MGNFLLPGGGSNDKNLRQIYLGAWLKINIQFFDSQMYLPVILTINLKLWNMVEYTDLGKIQERFWTLSPLEVCSNRQYVCLSFCWSWHEGWDNYQKIVFRKDGIAENEGIDFEIGDIGTSAH